MRFILLCYDDREYWESVGQAAHQAAIEEAVELTHELAAKGQFITAAPLEATATAKSVRVRNGIGRAHV